MRRIKKIVTTISFKNIVVNKEVKEYALTQMNDFLTTIDPDDYISYKIYTSNTGANTVLLTYKKIIK